MFSLLNRDIDTPKSSKSPLKFKFNAALNSSQPPKHRHPQYHRILACALVEYHYSIIILSQRDSSRPGN